MAEIRLCQLSIFWYHISYDIMDLTKHGNKIYPHTITGPLNYRRLVVHIHF